MPILNRKKIFLWGAASNYIAIIVSVIVALISVPIGLRYFGPVLYGIWLVIGSVLGYLRWCDFGIGAAVVTLMSQSTKSSNQRAILRYSIYLLVLISAALLIIIFIFVSLFPGWVGIIGKIPLNFQREASSALLAIVILTLFHLPMSVFLSTFSGIQKVHWNRFYSALYSVVTLIALLATVLVKGNLITLAVFTGIGNILVGVISGLHLFFLNPHIRLKSTNERETNNVPTIKLIFSSGIRFFALQLAALIILNTDNLVISHFLGPEKVTSYGVTFKLFYIFLTVINGSIAALWPMVGQAVGKNDYIWIQKAYNNVVLPLLIAGGGIWIGGIIFSESIINLWAGSYAYGGLVTAFALGGYVYLSSFTGINVSIANALNPTKIVVVFGFVEAILNLGLSLTLVKPLGIGGVALGTFIAALLTSSWFYPIYIKHRTFRKVTLEAKPIIIHIFIAISCVILSLLTVIYSYIGWVRFVIGNGIIILYLTLSWRVVSQDARNLMKDTLISFRTSIRSKVLY